MTARIVLISIIIVMWLLMLSIVLGLYLYMKHTKDKGGTLLDQAVNETKREDKMGISELLVYASFIGIFAYIAVSSINEGASPVIARLILLPPVLALFNARKRTGRSLLLVVAAFAILLASGLTLAIVGFPPKAPALTLNGSKIIMMETRISDLQEDGFQIFVRKGDTVGADSKRLLASGAYQLYDGTKGITVKKGIQEDDSSIFRARYVLARNGQVLGSLLVFSDYKTDRELKDCRLARIVMDKNCIETVKANKYEFYSDGIDMNGVITKEKMENTFKKNLSLNHDQHEGGRVYYVHYGANTIFWNEYGWKIHVYDNGEPEQLCYECKIMKE